MDLCEFHLSIYYHDYWTLTVYAVFQNFYVVIHKTKVCTQYKSQFQYNPLTMFQQESMIRSNSQSGEYDL